MSKCTITNMMTYSAAVTHRAIDEHLTEIVAKNTKLVEVGDGSIISIRNESGLSRHSLPILLRADDERNTFDKNLFMVDVFGMREHESNFMYTATVLTAIWEDESINETFNSVNRLAANLYVRWVGGTIIKQFGLDFFESDRIKVIIALYYILQGDKIDLSELKGDSIHRVIRQAADASGVPDKDVKEIVDKYDIIKDDDNIDFNWLFESLKSVSDILSYRMNPVSALSSVSNGFYRGMVAPPQLALNYKPFFIAMLYTVFSDRSAARTGLDQVVKATLEGRRRQQAETFIGAIEAIMKEQLKK